MPIRLVVLVLALLVLGCASEDRDAPGTISEAVFGVTEDSRVDAEAADLSRAGFMLVSEAGEILVTQPQDDVIKVFGPDGTARVVGHPGAGPGEFTNLTRIGWIGDSLWALDPGLKRVSIFGPDLGYVRSFPEPVSLRADDAAAAEDQAPLSVFVQAALPGGNLRVLGSFHPQRRAAWAEGLDSGAVAFLAVGEDGTVHRRLAVRGLDPCGVSYQIGDRGVGYTRIPLCLRQLDTGWEGGADLVLLEVADPTAAAGSYRVTLIHGIGDTTFSRNLGYQPIAVTQGAIDSVEERMSRAYATLPPNARAAMPDLGPAPFFPPVLRIHLGRDGSVWLEEHALDPGHHWLILDQAGEPVGRVVVPGNFRLMVADLGTIWGLEADEDGLESIVRYRVR